MDGAYTLYSNVDIKAREWSTRDLLLVGVATIFSIWYIKYLWQKRKVYWFGMQLPGPLSLPIIGSAWMYLGNLDDNFTAIMVQFNKYPGIFREWFGPKLVCNISDPKYIEIVLQNCLTKEELYSVASLVIGNGIFTAPYHTWKPNRKLIAPTFNQKILNTFVDVFAEQGEILVKQLKKYDGQGEFDVNHVVANCSLDIICETAMGVNVNAQETDSMFPIWMEKVMEILFLRIFQLWNYFDCIYFATALGKEARAITQKLHEFSSKVVKEKKAAFEKKLQEPNPDIEHYVEGGSRKIFLDYLLELTKAEGAEYSEQQLRDEVDTMIIAGSDTSTITECFVFTMLGLHPDLQDTVYNEIMEVIGNERRIEPEDLPKLKYLDRFIKETMRLFPIAGIIGRYVDRDIDLGDYVLPAGISAIIGIMRVHRNEAYWPNPLKFDPDRFLPEEVAKRPNCVYLPFSYGPRNCIGMKFAMMAMKTVIASVVRQYTIYTNYRAIEDIKVKQKFTMKPSYGFKVYIKSR